MVLAAAVGDLAGLLERECGLLNLVRLRFIETRLLLDADEARYLPQATAEVDQARVLACEVDLLRAASVQRSGRTGGDRRAPTLRELIDAAPRPWAGILADHGAALWATVTEIDVVGAANGKLARAGIRAAADALDGLSAAAPVRPLAGVSLPSRPIDLTINETGGGDAEVSLLLAERTYQDVITTATRLRMPALRRFLQ
jgi:hypothetical protein